MIKLKLKNNKRKLNKSGFTLIEVFFSFVVVVAISVIVINAFSKRESVFDEVKEYEMDHRESMKAVSKALLFSGLEDEYRINLNGYMPVTNINARNELHLVNLYSVDGIGVPSMRETNGKSYELFHRYVLGETTLVTYRDKLLDDYRVSISNKEHRNGKFKSTTVPNILVEERGMVTSPGVYYTIRGELFDKRNKNQKFNNVILPENDSSSEVIYYEETY